MELWKVFGLFLTLTIKEVCSDTWFELKLLRFDNPSGREADGDCCDWPCSDDCDPDITICFDKPDTGECSLAIRYTGHYHSNHITFSDTFPNGATNPMRVKIMEPWPETLYITVDVKDEDSINADDPMGKMRKTFTRTPDPNRENATWNSMSFVFVYQTMTAQARVYCDNHFYGDTCMTYCEPQDSEEKGHYTCAEDGSKKCMDTYHGADCKVKCIPADDDEKGHYYCDGNGNHVCIAGWTGDNCTEDINECETQPNHPCFPNGNCTNYNGTYKCDCDDAYVGRDCQEVKLFCEEAPCSNHSTCNNTLGGFDCICEEKWTGELCDNAVTPCTAKPCAHGGICRVIENPLTSTYQCDCVGVWAGPNCSREVKIMLNDTKTLYLKGRLPEGQWDELTIGIRHLLKDLLGITDVTIETTISYPTLKQTRVDIFVESRDPKVAGSLDKILFLPEEEVTDSLILPLSATQEVMKEPLAEKPDPWVKKHWYVVLIVVLVMIAVIGALVVVLVRVNKHRQAKREKLSFHSSTHSHASGISGGSDIAVGFDNSLYFEVNQPEKVRGLPPTPTK